MTDSIARLRAAGVSVWLDDLIREWLTSGSLAALRGRGVSGMTTNPTIFARAITDSNSYADQVDPRIAHETQRTVAEARALWWLVDRPKLFINIAAARQDLSAITACLAERISINVTLIFSLARYGEVIEAFRIGMKQARAAGWDLSGIASVALFFVSSVDTEVDRRLDKIGTGQAAAQRGKAAIANAGSIWEALDKAASGVSI